MSNNISGQVAFELVGLPQTFGPGETIELTEQAPKTTDQVDGSGSLNSAASYLAAVAGLTLIVGIGLIGAHNSQKNRLGSSAEHL